MLCYLIKPSTMTDKDMESPECMKQIKVQVSELRAQFTLSGRLCLSCCVCPLEGAAPRQDQHLPSALPDPSPQTTASLPLSPAAPQPPCHPFLSPALGWNRLHCQPGASPASPGTQSPRQGSLSARCPPNFWSGSGAWAGLRLLNLPGGCFSAGTSSPSSRRPVLVNTSVLPPCSRPPPRYRPAESVSRASSPCLSSLCPLG